MAEGWAAVPHRNLREQLVARLDRLRAPVRGARGTLTSADRADPETDERLRRLEARMSHLEATLEGLQDSVYRETSRLEESMADMRQRIEPHNLSQALSADARRRGV
jgi:uncharacterized coiled-coil protein SlyX